MRPTAFDSPPSEPLALALLAIGAATAVVALAFIVRARSGHGVRTAPLACLIAFGVENVVAGLVAPLGPPAWVLLAAFAEVVCVFAVWMAALWLRGTAGGDDGDDWRGFGHGPPDPDRPDPSGDGGPAWWPEFERQLAAYSANRERVPVA